MKRFAPASVLLALTIALGLLISCGGDSNTTPNPNTIPNGSSGPPTNIIPMPTTSRNADIAVTNSVESETRATLTAAASGDATLGDPNATVPAVTTSIAAPQGISATLQVQPAGMSTAAP